MSVLRVTLFVLLGALVAHRASAEPVTTIRDNGDPANRVDIVILGDGYTAAELPRYANDVERLVNGFFAQQPFREYQRYFNVHRIDVTSADSGADHPHLGIFKETALGAFYNCFGIERLLCVEDHRVFDVLIASIAPERRDVILVIVNDPEYGGSGGTVAVASIHPDVIELVLHELGHSFGLLADEYVDPPLCNDGVEPAEANVTKETNPINIKWNVGGGPPTGWIEITTPVPTTSPSPGLVGLYEGARYCARNLYRPTFNSKMRSLNQPFEQVNSEQLVRRVYNWVSPIDASEPAASNITLPANGRQEFSIATPMPATGRLEVTWKVNDQEVGFGNRFTFNATALSPGIYTVAVVVEDPTRFVRDDPANVLMDTRLWTVNIDSALVRPDTEIRSGPLVLSKSANAVFVFTATVAGSKFTCSLDGAPFTPCRSPKKYPKLSNGFHTFQVMATDLQGLSDESPETYNWTVDTIRPETTITLAPAATSNQTSANFEFASDDGSSTFQCKLNGGAYVPCTSPQTYMDLLPGRHTFQVAASDSAGNTDNKPALHKWTIDTAAPETTIRAKPPVITSNPTANFRFSATQRGSTFECSLNGGGFQSCGSRQMFSVTPGAHTIEVRATDPAGNLDLSPASYSWTLTMAAGAGRALPLQARRPARSQTRLTKLAKPLP